MRMPTALPQTILLQTFQQDKAARRIARSSCGAKHGRHPADLRQWNTTILICPDLNRSKSKQGRHIIGFRPLFPRCVSLLQRALFSRSTRHPIPQSRAVKSLCGNGHKTSLCDGHRSSVNPVRYSPHPHRSSATMALAVKPPLQSPPPTPPLLSLGAGAPEVCPGTAERSSSTAEKKAAWAGAQCSYTAVRWRKYSIQAHQYTVCSRKRPVCWKRSAGNHFQRKASDQRSSRRKERCRTDFPPDCEGGRFVQASDPSGQALCSENTADRTSCRPGPSTGRTRRRCRKAGGKDRR